MLVVMNTNATEQDINKVVLYVEERGFEARLCKGETKSVVAAVGNKEIDKRDIELLSGVHEVIKLTTSYKLTSRSFQQEDTIVEINAPFFGINFFAFF